MKIYLDNCSLQRPLDDKTQPRILLESEAIAVVLRLCEFGDLTLVSSQILRAEINRNPNPRRRELASEILAVAGEDILLSAQIKILAKEFEERGFQPIDALHLACAESLPVDYFCTCDDKFLKKAKAQNDLKIKIVSPLELAEEILI